MDKDKLSEICESEFKVFSEAISKMGFDPQGFSFMILFNKKSLSRESLIKDGWSLSEEELTSIENRVKLFS